MQVLPHGLEMTKFVPSVMSVETPFNRSFVFLFNGGLLPRKGPDIALQVNASADEISLCGALRPGNMPTL